MKKTFVISSMLAVLAISTTALSGCATRDAEPAAQQAAATDGAEVLTVTIPVEGMTCSACAAGVKSTLGRMEGIHAVEVNLAERHARVSYVAAQTSPEQIAAAIDEMGYKSGTPVPEPRS